MPTFRLRRPRGAALALLLALGGALGAGAPSPAFAQGVMDRLAAGEPLRLAVRRDARPLSYLSNGAPGGYTVSVCTEAAKRLARDAGLEGLRFDYVPVDPADRFDAVAEGRADLLCGAASITLERRRRVEFSLPVFVDGAGVMVRAEEIPDGFTDFAGRRIGVLEGTTTERGLRTTLEALGMEAEVVALGSHDAGIDALLAGEVDGWFADRAILLGLSQTPRAVERVAVADETLTVERQALALPKGDEGFREAVDAALSRMFRDGTMATLFGRAFPGARPGLALEALWLLGGVPD